MDPALRCLVQALLLRELVDAIRAPPAGTFCDRCGAHEPTNRCWDCFWPELLCTACIAAGHAEQPLHRIEIWNGEKWVTGSLREIGVRIHLGHGRHGRCPRPIYNPRYAIVNTRGTHEVGMCFCACDEAQDPNDQLRQAGLLSVSLDMAVAIDSGAVVGRGTRRPGGYRIAERAPSPSPSEEHVDTASPLPSP
ncbi:hypothetical protein B0H11DRAFT_2234353 [Mycena galericulata]|nr:hypothetical protein B0H11DRAFT_2234353 [Mycena galericulata]